MAAGGSLVDMFSGMSREEVDDLLSKLSPDEMSELVDTLAVTAQEDSRDAHGEHTETRMESLLRQIDEILSSEEFQNSTSEFFRLHCSEFTDEDENRLEYTTIHQQFEALVESYLVTLGEDYAYFCENFAEFLQDPGEMTKSRLQTLDTLTGMADFEIFKATMLSTKSEMKLEALEAQLCHLENVPLS
jgi:polyhydroxyalkanoate synthesis regulator phasin